MAFRRSRGRVAASVMVLLTSMSTAQAQTLSATATTPTKAFGFAQAFDAALANDPQFRSARFERESTQAAVPIARAALLPSASLSLSDTHTLGTRALPNAANQQITLPLDYRAPQASLQARAPIFNWESISRYRQALVQSDAADTVFKLRGGELMERLSTAYLQRLMGEENLRLVQTQLDALETQRERAEQRLKRGEGTRIEVAEVSAQFDATRVRLLDVRDQIVVARRALLRITGVDAPEVQGLPKDFQPPPLSPQNLDEWLSRALAGNATLTVRQQQVAVARMGIQRSQAGHFPRLDAVATVSRNSNESLSNLNQSSKLTSIGLQLNIPLFNGFGTDASVQQSRSDLARAEAELDNERENVSLEVQKQFLAASNGRARIAALQQATASMELALEGVTRGVAAGLRTIADVAESQTRVFSTRRDLAQARMDYLLARMRLMAQAGASPQEVVQDVESLMLAVRSEAPSK
jgi:outer membrane protein, protease secretion system